MSAELEGGSDKYDKPLRSYEEFVERYSNFADFFAPLGSMTGDMNRKEDVYQRCLSEHPEFAAIAAELQAYDFSEFDIDEATGKVIIRPVDPKREEMMHKLYDAYLLMRPYAKNRYDLPI